MHETQQADVLEWISQEVALGWGSGGKGLMKDQSPQKATEGRGYKQMSDFISLHGTVGRGPCPADLN